MENCTPVYSVENLSQCVLPKLSRVREIYVAPWRETDVQINSSGELFNLVYTDTKEAPVFLRLDVYEKGCRVINEFSEGTTDFYDSFLNIQHDSLTPESVDALRRLNRGRFMAIIKDARNQTWIIGAVKGLRAESYKDGIDPDDFDFVISYAERRSSFGMRSIKSDFIEPFTPVGGGLYLSGISSSGSGGRRAEIPHDPAQNLFTFPPGPLGWSIYIKYVNYSNSPNLDTDNSIIFRKGRIFEPTQGREYLLTVRPYAGNPNFHFLQFTMEDVLGVHIFQTPNLPNAQLIDFAVKFDGLQEITFESNNFDVSPKYTATISLANEANTKPLEFGAAVSGNIGFNGIIYDFKIFDEFTDLANCIVNPGSYSIEFDEDFGFEFIDSNQNQGQLLGFTSDEVGVPSQSTNIAWVDLLQRRKVVRIS